MTGSSKGLAPRSSAAMASATMTPLTSPSACARSPERVPACATSPVVPILRKFITVNSAANSFAPMSTAPCVGASPNRPTIHISPTPISAVATLVAMAGSAMAQIRRGSIDAEAALAFVFTEVSRVPAAALPERRHIARGAGSRNTGRGDWIRTSDPLYPKQVRYQAAPLPDRFPAPRRAWWARQDSNPRPSRYERPALTN